MEDQINISSCSLIMKTFDTVWSRLKYFCSNVQFVICPLKLFFCYTVVKKYFMISFKYLTIVNLQHFTLLINYKNERICRKKQKLYQLYTICLLVYKSELCFIKCRMIDNIFTSIIYLINAQLINLVTECSCSSKGGVILIFDLGTFSI